MKPEDWFQLLNQRAQRECQKISNLCKPKPLLKLVKMFSEINNDETLNKIDEYNGVIILYH